MSFGIYETVTNRIIAELEAGAIPWTQPWKNQKSGGVMPLNRATGRPYSGINIPILWGAASAFGYPTHQWLTFKQALDMKACVKKSEKGTQVVFTKRIPRDDDEEHGTISMLKTFYFLNLQQIDGLERMPTPELARIMQRRDVSASVGRRVVVIFRNRACSRTRGIVSGFGPETGGGGLRVEGMGLTFGAAHARCFR